MKKTGFISVEHNPGDPLIKTNTDWARVHAMTAEEIHAAARSDPDAQGFRSELTRRWRNRDSSASPT